MIKRVAVPGRASFIHPLLQHAAREDAGGIEKVQGIESIL
jgi:hypothetical protein